MNPRFPSVPPAFSVKPVKTHGAASEIVSFDPAPDVSKPLIEPANAAGSLSASSPPLRHVCVMVEVAPEVILKSPCE
jgi:hypothetical protein